MLLFFNKFVLICQIERRTVAIFCELARFVCTHIKVELYVMYVNLVTFNCVNSLVGRKHIFFVFCNELDYSNMLLKQE